MTVGNSISVLHLSQRPEVRSGHQGALRCRDVRSVGPDHPAGVLRLREVSPLLPSGCPSIARDCRAGSYSLYPLLVSCSLLSCILVLSLFYLSLHFLSTCSLLASLHALSLLLPSTSCLSFSLDPQSLVQC